MDPADIANCQFVPLSAVEKAIDFVDNERLVTFSHCKRDLLKMQKRHSHALRTSQRVNVLKRVYHHAMYNAIYSQDWNKLLYLLKKVPIWQQEGPQSLLSIYVRSLAILLMYHPSAQAQGLLAEYFHLVCTCRTDAEKNALMKIILTLPATIRHNVYRLVKGLKQYQNIDTI